ncbi:DUF2953 domain-containing protein [Oxobacter pfennigii]|nr:DUF2953 domain-containing protein [Oxobacter pfennigii]
MKFVFHKEAGKRAEMTIKILFFSFSPDMSSHQSKKKDTRKKKNKKASVKITKELIKKLLSAIGEAFVHIKPKVFQAEGKIGFDDPYHTGILSAFVCSLPLRHEGFNVNIEPVFDREVMEGKLVIQGRIIPAVLIWIALKLLISRPVRNILFKERKKNAYAK